jgi:hypothetical protein
MSAATTALVPFVQPFWMPSFFQIIGLVFVWLATYCFYLYMQETQHQTLSKLKQLQEQQDDLLDCYLNLLDENVFFKYQKKHQKTHRILKQRLCDLQENTGVAMDTLREMATSHQMLLDFYNFSKNPFDTFYVEVEFINEMLLSVTPVAPVPIPICVHIVHYEKTPTGNILGPYNWVISNEIPCTDYYICCFHEKMPNIKYLIVPTHSYMQIPTGRGVVVNIMFNLHKTFETIQKIKQQGLKIICNASNAEKPFAIVMK